MGSIPRLRSVVVGNDPQPRSFRIVKLSALERQPEHTSGEKHERNAERHQQIENVQNSDRRQFGTASISFTVTLVASY